MNISQILFLAIIISGGRAVVFSYIWGFKSGISINSFWGNVPVRLRGLYNVSIFACALMFFVFTSFIFINLGGTTVRFVPESFLGDKAFHILYAVIMLFSTVWMPLTASMISKPSKLIWIGVRAALALVGLSFLGITVLLIMAYSGAAGVYYYLALISAAWVTIHTGILDAVIWAHYWNKK
jgi:hypothetical protein